MKRHLFTSCLLLAAFAATSLRAAETKSDWCTLATPDKAEMDKPFDVVVTLGADVPKAKLAVDLHWMKKDGSFGGMLGWVPRRDVAGGETVTISHRPDLKEEMGSVSALAYLSPDGDYATRTMRWLAILLCSAIGLHAEPVQLDLSSGFNSDAWCGAAEFQFMQTYRVANGSGTLSSLQGQEPAAAYYLAEQYAGGQMVGCSSTQRYAIPANWFYDRAWAWVVGHEGTPENGVVTGAYDRVYHIASHAGNATLPGDWLS